MPTLILMYHRVLADNEPGGNLHAIGSSEFARQLAYLKERRVPVVRWSDGFPPPPQRALQVGITFDDANSSDLASAEKLTAAGYEAIFFIPTGSLGMPGHLDERGVRELLRLRMTVGSHSHGHRPLASLADDALHEELASSKAILERLVGSPVIHVSFPGGDYDARVLAAARRLGYRYLHTSDWGVNQPRDVVSGMLKRVPVMGCDAARFADIVATRHQTLRRAQFHAKQLVKQVLGVERYTALRDVFLRRRLR